MTDDNWSLKRKRHYGFKVKNGNTFGDTYLVDDIEILRQRLIEDFKQGFPKNQLEVEYLINKRFGVE